MKPVNNQPGWPRRRVLRFLTTAGLGTAAFGRAVVALADGSGKVTAAMIERASWISGIEFTQEQRELMLNGVNALIDHYQTLRQISISHAVGPAVSFRPVDSSLTVGSSPASDAAVGPRDLTRPSNDAELAFLSVTELGHLLRTGQVTATELTRLFLARLQTHGPKLECVITLTEERALRQAQRADDEINSGNYRGPLHGIPWGAKDLLAVPDYPTTWGAAPFKEQVINETATVVERLDQAGAVMIAKLSLGALAWGDVWFGGKTRNPWNLDQGSSGSSAGSAAATSAGLVGFAVGSETWGSIVSPCTRCGVTGLRPTFGRVSRHGAMPLSWSMDKLGPIARTVEDTAMILAAIAGSDPMDSSTIGSPFFWDQRRDVRELRVGYLADLFTLEPDAKLDDERRQRILEGQQHDREVLNVLRELGVNLLPIELSTRYPVRALELILTAEASTAFDELTRSGRDAEMVRQIENAWPNVFRQGQTIPAVEYLRANRIRTLVIGELEETMQQLDAFIAPSFAGDHLLRTNLTGHPAVVVPNGLRDDGTPTSITFTGKLMGEDKLLTLAAAYQNATDHHLRRPPHFVV